MTRKLKVQFNQLDKVGRGLAVTHIYIPWRIQIIKWINSFESLLKCYN